MSSTLSNLTYHIVFSTKFREPLITPELRDELYPYIGGVVRNKGGALIRIGGVADHLHLVLRLRPDITLSDMVRLVKANSSKWVNEQRTGSGGRFAWQGWIRRIHGEPFATSRAHRIRGAAGGTPPGPAVSG